MIWKGVSTADLKIAAMGEVYIYNLCFLIFLKKRFTSSEIELEMKYLKYFRGGLYYVIS